MNCSLAQILGLKSSRWVRVQVWIHNNIEERSVCGHTVKSRGTEPCSFYFSCRQGAAQSWCSPPEKQKEAVLLINDYQFCASNFCNYIPSTNSPFQRKIETFKLITKFAEPLAAGCCRDGFTAQGDQQPSSTPFIIQPAGPGHAAQLVLVEIWKHWCLGLHFSPGSMVIHVMAVPNAWFSEELHWKEMSACGHLDMCDMCLCSTLLGLDDFSGLFYP